MKKIDEIALRVAIQYGLSRNGERCFDDSELIDFTNALLAELSKDAEPVAYLYQGVNGADWHNERVIARTTQECGRNQYPDTWKEIGPLFTRPAPVIASEQKPVAFNVISDGREHKLYRKLIEAQLHVDRLIKGFSHIAKNPRIEPLFTSPPNTADIEQRVAEAIAKFITSWFKDKGSDLGLADLVSSGKWREYP